MNPVANDGVKQGNESYSLYFHTRPKRTPQGIINLVQSSIDDVAQSRRTEYAFSDAVQSSLTPNQVSSRM